MKFQDSSFNGLKVTVGTKSVTHARTHAPKAICPINFFKVGGITKSIMNKHKVKHHRKSDTKTANRDHIRATALERSVMNYWGA